MKAQDSVLGLRHFVGLETGKKTVSTRWRAETVHGVGRRLGQAHDRMQVVLAPLAVLQGHTIRVIDGHVGFVFADDPAFVVPLRPATR